MRINRQLAYALLLSVVAEVLSPNNIVPAFANYFVAHPPPEEESFGIPEPPSDSKTVEISLQLSGLTKLIRCQPELTRSFEDLLYSGSIYYNKPLCAVESIPSQGVDLRKFVLSAMLQGPDMVLNLRKMGRPSGPDVFTFLRSAGVPCGSALVTSLVTEVTEAATVTVYSCNGLLSEQYNGTLQELPALCCNSDPRSPSPPPQPPALLPPWEDQYDMPPSPPPPSPPGVVAGSTRPPLRPPPSSPAAPPPQMYLYIMALPQRLHCSKLLAAAETVTLQYGLTNGTFSCRASNNIGATTTLYGAMAQLANTSANGISSSTIVPYVVVTAQWLPRTYMRAVRLVENGLPNSVDAFASLGAVPCGTEIRAVLLQSSSLAVRLEDAYVCSAVMSTSYLTLLKHSGLRVVSRGHLCCRPPPPPAPPPPLTPLPRPPPRPPPRSSPPSPPPLVPSTPSRPFTSPQMQSRPQAWSPPIRAAAPPPIRSPPPPAPPVPFSVPSFPSAPTPQAPLQSLPGISPAIFTAPLPAPSQVTEDQQQSNPATLQHASSAPAGISREAVAVIAALAVAAVVSTLAVLWVLSRRRSQLPPASAGAPGSEHTGPEDGDGDLPARSTGTGPAAGAPSWLGIALKQEEGMAVAGKAAGSECDERRGGNGDLQLAGSGSLTASGSGSGPASQAGSLLEARMVRLSSAAVAVDHVLAGSSGDVDLMASFINRGIRDGGGRGGPGSAQGGGARRTATERLLGGGDSVAFVRTLSPTCNNPLYLQLSPSPHHQPLTSAGSGSMDAVDAIGRYLPPPPPPASLMPAAAPLAGPSSFAAMDVFRNAAHNICLSAATSAAPSAVGVLMTVSGTPHGFGASATLPHDLAGPPNGNPHVLPPALPHPVIGLPYPHPPQPARPPRVPAPAVSSPDAPAGSSAIAAPAAAGPKEVTLLELFKQSPLAGAMLLNTPSSSLGGAPPTSSPSPSPPSPPTAVQPAPVTHDSSPWGDLVTRQRSTPACALERLSVQLAMNIARLSGERLGQEAEVVEFPFGDVGVQRRQEGGLPGGGVRQEGLVARDGGDVAIYDCIRRLGASRGSEGCVVSEPQLRVRRLRYVGVDAALECSVPKTCGASGGPSGSGTGAGEASGSETISAAAASFSGSQDTSGPGTAFELPAGKVDTALQLGASAFAPAPAVSAPPRLREASEGGSLSPSGTPRQPSASTAVGAGLPQGQGEVGPTAGRLRQEGRNAGGAPPSPIAAPAAARHPLPPLGDSGVDISPGELRIQTDGLLGAGAFGSVFRGSYRGQPVAIKVLHHLHLAAVAAAGGPAGAGALLAARDVEAFRQEIAILRSLTHPNIVRVLGGCAHAGHPFLVMELLPCCLHNVIHGINGRHPLQTVLRIAADVARGLCHLHPAIVHRDLKPANILLDAAGTAKISDFGLARYHLKPYISTQQPDAGSVAYMAPEGFDPAIGRLSAKCDVYSFGVLLWELLTQEHPWAGESNVAIIYRVAVHRMRLPLPTDPRVYPPRLGALLNACMSYLPANRPDMRYVLRELEDMLQLVMSGAEEALLNGGEQLQSSTQLVNGPYAAQPSS